MALAQSMSDAQSDEDEEIQAFGRWISSARRQGMGGSNHETPCGYIPIPALKEYLSSNHRVEDLLKALFDKEAIKSLDVDIIQTHYLRSLAILLLIGKGRMIKHFVHYRALRDEQLPHKSRPEDFPFSSDPGFFECFFDQQWQFCAVDLEYNMNIYFHKEEILPITLKEEIARGANAIFFKIVVDEEYNKLIRKQWKMPVRIGLS